MNIIFIIISMNNNIEYDDNNIHHINNAPDYGQPYHSLAWNLESSDEYQLQLEFSNNIITIEPIITLDL